MLVARLLGAHELVVGDEPAPVPGPDDALVRVAAVGLCGSDTHWWETAGIGDTRLDRGLVLGHEIAGTIVEDGRVTPVVVDPSQPCGTCPTCTAGSEDLCPSARFAGFGETDGGLREWMAWPRRLLVPVPAGLDPAEACQLEALGVALRAVERGGVGPSTRVAVVGTGPIGLLVVRACRARGATAVLATDRLSHRVEAARISGATAAWLAEDDAVHADTHPVDVALECAGTNAAFDTAIRLVRPGGHVVVVGIPEDDRIAFSASTARRKGLTVSFSRRMRAADLHDAAALVGDGRVSLDGLVTLEADLADAADAFEVQAARTGVKVVVRTQSYDRIPDARLPRW